MTCAFVGAHSGRSCYREAGHSGMHNTSAERTPIVDQSPAKLTRDERAIHANWGRADAEYDIARGMRNREYIAPGECFQLPGWDPDYVRGYRAAWFERSA